MKYLILLSVAMTLSFIRCGQGHHQGTASVVVGQKLTCLLIGYDSAIYYTGISDHMQGITRGKVTDTVFVNGMFEKIKTGGLSVTLKPGDGGGVMANVQELLDLAKQRGLPACSVDSTDSNEERVFGVPTAPPLREMMRGQAPEMKLSLPQTASDSPVLPASLPASSQLVILVPGGDDVYAYTGGNIQNARKYSYQKLTDLLKAKSADTACWVLLRPAATATYRNTVDLLDILQKTGIKHYVLVDITKEEKDYLHLLK